MNLGWTLPLKHVESLNLIIYHKNIAQNKSQNKYQRRSLVIFGFWQGTGGGGGGLKGLSHEK